MTQNTITREAGSCAHCGSAEGRIEHGAYYNGMPVCDACNSYADESCGRLVRPVSTADALHNIHRAADLDNLLQILRDIDAILPEEWNTIDYSGLPTFGGAEPADTTGIWSWDENNLLTNDGNGWHIEPRVPVTSDIAEA